MKFRQVPPTGAPVSASAVLGGVAGLFQPAHAIGRLERGLASTLDVEHVFLVSSGRAALTLILHALQRLSRRRRVIIPAYTCYSVPAAIVRAGLEVVPCDLGRGTLDFDHDQLAALVTKTKPLCVVPTHLFGLPSDVSRVSATCRPEGVLVVEDAAQALGSTAAGALLGTSGDVGFYSFGRGKTITSGNGGAVITRSPEIAQALEIEYARFPRPGAARSATSLLDAIAIALLLRPSLYWLPASLPFLRLGETSYSTSFRLERLSGVQAGLLRNWMRRVQAMNEIRTLHAAALSAFIPRGADHGGSPCVRLPLLCCSRAQRDLIYETGRREGLGFSLVYPGAVNAIPALRNMLHGTRFPEAESVAERLLTIPVHPLLSRADRQAIEDVLQRTLQPYAECA